MFKFKGDIDGTRFAVIVSTHDIAEAVNIATRMETCLTLASVVPEGEISSKISARELRQKADLFRSRILQACILGIADAISTSDGGPNLLDLDDKEFAREQGGQEREGYVVRCVDGNADYTAGVFVSREKAKAFIEGRYRAAGRPFKWADDPLTAHRPYPGEPQAIDACHHDDEQCHLCFYAIPTVIVG